MFNVVRINGATKVKFGRNWLKNPFSSFIISAQKSTMKASRWLIQSKKNLTPELLNLLPTNCSFIHEIFLELFTNFFHFSCRIVNTFWILSVAEYQGFVIKIKTYLNNKLFEK